jgi:hypothetical protein
MAIHEVLGRGARQADEDLTTPEHKLHQAPAHGSRNPLFELWLKPIARPYDRIVETADKPIGDLTVPEAMDWVFCLGYAGLTGYVIGKAAGNLLEVALGGRRR